MSRSEDNLRLSVVSPVSVESLPDADPAAGVPERDGDDDPFTYGWRWETPSGGSGSLRQVPLTYEDLLSPEVGDFIAESTIHHKVTAEVAGILERRYADEPSVAVWSDLKIAFRIPGLTTGPGPDVCVVEGVVDRDRDRRSFRYGQESGEVALTIEVVSKKSKRKDHEDILEIYRRLGVREYLAVRPTGHYSDGPFELRGWRRDPQTGWLESIRPDREGRLRLRTVGVLAGTGPEGWGLKIWDAATGERLRTPAAAAARRAVQAEQRAREEAERAVEAEGRAERAEEHAVQEAAARLRAEEEKRKAEERSQEMTAEIERLRTQLHGRQGQDV